MSVGIWGTSDDKAQAATALLAITKAVKQTAFLISDDGLVASAGHGFEEAKSQIGSSFDIQFTGAASQRATLLEYEYLDSEGVDYALLRLDDPKRAPKAIRISTRTRDILKKRFVIFGYRVGASIVLTRASGSVLGKAPFRSGRGHYLELLTQQGSLAGLSGGPICGETSLVAYGIQTHQLGSTTTALGTPFEVIRARSRLLDEFIRNQTDPLDLDYDLFAKLSAHNAPIFRSNIFLLPLVQSTPYDEKLWDRIGHSWLAFVERFDDICNRISWLRRKPQRATVKLDKLLFNVRMPAPFWDLLSDELISGESIGIRTVSDLTGAVVSINTKQADTREETHLVGVMLAEADAMLPSDGTFDARFAIARQDVDITATKFLHVLEDVLVDIFVFNSIPIVRQLYQTTEERKAFSRAKVVFAEKHDLLPYGLSRPGSDLGYVSFRSCSREAFNGEVDERRYHSAWKEFVNSFLFSSLAERNSGVTPTLAVDEVLARVQKLPKLYGQISPAKITRQLDASGATDGELCALAFATRRPHMADVRAAMATFFGRRRWRSNMSRVFSRSQLRDVLRYSDFVTLYFFRFRRRG
jgi:hypothetical protein